MSATSDPRLPGSRHTITDHTRLGQTDLIELERDEHQRRGTVPMSRMLQDPELHGLIEQVADKLATLGARDPVNVVELRWGAGSAGGPVSLRWRRDDDREGEHAE